MSPRGPDRVPRRRPRRRPRLPAGLSPREREVLTLRTQGLRHREIAERLGISAHTVKNHITSIHGRALRILGWV